MLKLASVLANLCEFKVAFDAVDVLSSVADGARDVGLGGIGGGRGIVVLHASLIGCLLANETNEENKGNLGKKESAFCFVFISLLLLVWSRLELSASYDSGSKDSSPSP